MWQISYPREWCILGSYLAWKNFSPFYFASPEIKRLKFVTDRQTNYLTRGCVDFFFKLNLLPPYSLCSQGIMKKMGLCLCMSTFFSQQQITFFCLVGEQEKLVKSVLMLLLLLFRTCNNAQQGKSFFISKFFDFILQNVFLFLQKMFVIHQIIGTKSKILLDVSKLKSKCSHCCN